MEMFYKSYSFRLNNVQDNLSSNFCGEQIEFTSMCLLDCLHRSFRKYKKPFSFKADTPCSINECLSKYCKEHK